MSLLVIPAQAGIGVGWLGRRAGFPGFPLLPGEGEGEVMRYPTRSVTSHRLAEPLVRREIISSPHPRPLPAGEGNRLTWVAGVPRAAPVEGRACF